MGSWWALGSPGCPAPAKPRCELPARPGAVAGIPSTQPARLPPGVWVMVFGLWYESAAAPSGALRHSSLLSRSCQAASALPAPHRAAHRARLAECFGGIGSTPGCPHHPTVHPAWGWVHPGTAGSSCKGSSLGRLLLRCCWSLLPERGSAQPGGAGMCRAECPTPAPGHHSPDLGQHTSSTGSTHGTSTTTMAPRAPAAPALGCSASVDLQFPATARQ